MKPPPCANERVFIPLAHALVKTGEGLPGLIRSPSLAQERSIYGSPIPSHALRRAVPAGNAPCLGRFGREPRNDPSLRLRRHALAAGGALPRRLGHGRRWNS